MGTLVFRHNGRNIRHEECLYDPSYSNTISGLRMPEEFTVQGKKEKVEVKVGKRILYKMDRDNTGMWIKPENAIEGWKAAGIKRINSQEEELAKELHERINEPAAPQWKHWRKALAAAKSRCLSARKRKRSDLTKLPVAKLPVADRGSTVARMTRPEISVHANLLGRRTKDATNTHWNTALQVLRYLVSTKYEGLHLKKTPTLSLTIYTDAAYGGEGSRSQTGAMTCLGNQLVGWYSRRQDVVSLSITEAEYIADCEGAKDASWAQQFLKELNILTTPTLYTDSEGAYGLSKSPKFARRSRHIEHRFHYLRQQVRSEKLQIVTIPGKDNPADLLTKLLPMAAINQWKQRWMSTAEPSF